MSLVTDEEVEVVLGKIKLHLQQMKVLDILIIAILFASSFIPHAIYAYQLQQLDDQAVKVVARVTIDGQEVYSTELSEETPHEEFTLYPGEGQYNVIEVDGDRIRNKEDNSPNQIGVKRGWISKPGESAIVLPHRLVVDVHAVNDDGQEVSPGNLEDQEDESGIQDQEDVIIPN